MKKKISLLAIVILITVSAVSLAACGGKKTNAQTPNITGQPQSASVAVGITHDLSVTASVTDGGTLSYQWYSNTTNSTASGTAVSGATNAAYSAPINTAGTTYYYVVVTNTNNAVNGTKTAAATSNAAAITVTDEQIVNAATPSISAQPTGGTYGQNATAQALSVTAGVTDSGVLSYQWYSNTANNASESTRTSVGTNSNTFTPPTTTAGTLYYFVVVTNTNNAVNGTKTATVTSSIVAVTVNAIVNAQAPNITNQPQSATVTQNAIHALTITAASSDSGTLSYKWYSNTSASNSGGTVIADATNSTYSVPTSAIGTFHFYCVVTNTIADNLDGGQKTAAVTSNAVTITINNLVNAQAPNITAQPQGGTTVVNGTHTLTVTANSTDSGSLSYQWYSNTGASNSGGTAVSGATNAAYNVPTGTVGTYYFYCVITNTISDNGDGGQKSVAAASIAVTVTVSAPIINAQTPAITTQPQGATVTQNATHALNVAASVTDGGTLSYQWYSNTGASNSGGTAINGATNASYSPNTAAVGTFYYYCVVTNTNNSVNGTKTATARSSAATVKVNAAQVERTLTGITITKAPNKTDYTVGERLSTLGMIVTASYSNGDSVTVTGWEVDLDEPLSLTDTLVTVAYIEGGVTVSKTFAITVSARTLSRIEITGTVKKAYVEGQTFDTASMVVTVYYSDSTHKVVSDYILAVIDEGGTPTGYLSALTTDIIRVGVFYYEGDMSNAVSEIITGITVNQKELTSIRIAAQPAKTAYKVGEKFDRTGLVVEAVYNNGALTRVVQVTNSMLSKTGTLDTSDNKITVTFTEYGATKTVDITITVTARALTSISVTQNPDNLIYIEGEYFNPLGMIITANYSDSDPAVVSGWTYNTNALTTADTQITIEYRESGVVKTASVTITVNPRAVTPQNVQSLISAINALPPVSTLSYEHMTMVYLLLDLYEDLTESEQALVSNYSVLSAAKTKVDSAVENREHRITYENYPMQYQPDVNDVSRNGNPVSWKKADGKVELNPAISAQAAAAGYVFLGWTSNWNGYSATDLVTHLENLTSDLRLYAVFVETFDITYVGCDSEGNEFGDLNTGSNPVKWSLADGKVALSAAESAQAATKGLVFAGWFDVRNGQPVTHLENLNFNITLAALFSRASFAVSYQSDISEFDDIEHSNPSSWSVSGGEVSLTEPTSVKAAAAGYIFSCWQQHGNTVTSLANLTDDVMLTAVFVKDRFVINYVAEDEIGLFGDFNRGDNPLTWTKSTDGRVTLKAASSAQAEALGYVFDYWVNQSTGNRVTALNNLTDDITLVAIFKLEGFRINYYEYDSGGRFNDITHSNPLTWKKGTSVQLTAANSQDAADRGYVFSHWSNYNTNEKITHLANLTGNITLQAVFKQSETVLIKFVDRDNPSSVLYTVSPSRSTVDYYFDSQNARTAIIAAGNLGTKYPAAFYHGENDYQISSIYLLEEKAVITVLVGLADTFEITFDQPNGWRLSYSYDYGTNNFNGNIYQGATHRLPQGAQIRIEKASSLLAGISINGTPSDFSEQIILNSDIAVTFTVSTEMALFFSSSYAGPLYFNLTADGMLDESAINQIRDRFDSEEAYSATYSINGGTAMTLAQLEAYTFTFVAGTTVEIIAVRTPRETMTLQIGSNDLGWNTLAAKYDNWNGKLTQNDLDNICWWQTDDKYVYSYSIGGSVYSYDELADVTITFEAGATVVIEVIRVKNYFEVKLYIENGVDKNGWSELIPNGKTLEETVSSGNMIRIAIESGVVIYTDTARTQVWSGGLDTVIEQDITLYAARRTEFDITLDMKYNELTDLFAVAADDGFTVYSLYSNLPTPTRSGYIFDCWEYQDNYNNWQSLTQYQGNYLSLLLVRSQAFTLRANWIELEDAADSEILGKWFYWNGYNLRVYEFNADGTGVYVSLSNDNYNTERRSFSFTDNGDGSFTARINNSDYNFSLNGNELLNYYDWNNYTKHNGESFVVFESNYNYGNLIFEKDSDWDGKLSQWEIENLRDRYYAAGYMSEGRYLVGGNEYSIDELEAVTFDMDGITFVTVTRTVITMVLEFRGNYTYETIYLYRDGKISSSEINDLRNWFEERGLYTAVFTFGGNTYSLEQLAQYNFTYETGVFVIYVTQTENPNMDLRFESNFNSGSIYKLDGWNGKLTEADLNQLRDWCWDAAYDYTFTVNGTVMTLSELAGYSFTYAAGTRLVITIEREPAEVMTLQFYSDYSGSATLTKRADWDGKLTGDDISYIRNQYDGSSSYIVTYYVDGTEMTLAQLSSYTFSFYAYDTVFIDVTRAQAESVEVRIYFANGNDESYVYSYATQGKTIGEMSYWQDEDAAIKAAVSQLVLYTDSACTIVWTGNLNTVVTGKLTLYAAKRTAFTISFDTMGGDYLSGITVPADSGKSYYLDLPANVTKSGHFFDGWSLTPDGKNIISNNWAYINNVLQNYNKPVTLYAVWLELDNTADSQLLGTWMCVDGSYIYMIEFRADGTGVRTRMENFEYIEFANFAFSDKGGMLTMYMNGYTNTYALNRGDVLWYEGWEYNRAAETVNVVIYGNFQIEGSGREIILTLKLPGNISLSDMNDGQIVWYTGKTQADESKTLSELAVGGTVTLWKFSRSSIKNGTIRFIDLDTDGGSFSGVYPSYIPTIGNWYSDNSGGNAPGDGSLPSLSDYKPTKNGFYFVGWAAPNGDMITNLYSLWHTKYQGVTGLKAVWISGTAVNYAGQNFVGTWSYTGTNYDGYGSYVILKSTLTLNADGTYSTFTTHNGTIVIMDTSGIYRFIDGQIVFLTGDASFLSSYETQNFDLRFLEWNIIGAGDYVMTKGAVRPANYFGEDFLGVYRIYYKEAYPDGSYGEYDITITLLADGTFTVATIYTEYWNGQTDSESQTITGYYRVIDGKLVFAGLYYFDETFEMAVKDGDTEYSSLPVVGTWIAADETTQAAVPMLIVGDDGIVTVIHIDGTAYSYSYKQIAPGEYVALDIYYGGLIQVSQIGDRLVLTTQVYGFGTVTLTYTKAS